MKTTISQVFVIAIILIFSGANAFAAAESTGVGRTAASLATDSGPAQAVLGTGDNTMTVNVSKGVAIRYAGANAPNNSYSIGTLHNNGNREFATDDATSGIWWAVCAGVLGGANDCGVGNEPLGGASATSVTTTDLTGNWSAL